MFSGMVDIFKQMVQDVVLWVIVAILWTILVVFIGVKNMIRWLNKKIQQPFTSFDYCLWYLSCVGAGGFLANGLEFWPEYTRWYIILSLVYMSWFLFRAFALGYLHITKGKNSNVSKHSN